MLQLRVKFILTFIVFHVGMQVSLVSQRSQCSCLLFHKDQLKFQREKAEKDRSRFKVRAGWAKYVCPTSR
ncbi:hypothetical protein RchiOBHm_Chr4g0385391 [Rosa chinensis]|uniref:Secreted protein n=1 Tax=Rosa chinensis TaxID=74649 RepID=A0A2P6QNZ7_ROSCH|nr:hypothetical protein RchiOBHm_Chr4g0385391 [Rosa chinensis]